MAVEEMLCFYTNCETDIAITVKTVKNCRRKLKIVITFLTDNKGHTTRHIIHNKNADNPVLFKVPTQATICGLQRRFPCLFDSRIARHIPHTIKRMRGNVKLMDDSDRMIFQRKKFKMIEQIQFHCY